MKTESYLLMQDYGNVASCLRSACLWRGTGLEDKRVTEMQSLLHTVLTIFRKFWRLQSKYMNTSLAKPEHDWKISKVCLSEFMFFRAALWATLARILPFSALFSEVLLLSRNCWKQIGHLRPISSWATQ